MFTLLKNHSLLQTLTILAACLTFACLSFASPGAASSQTERRHEAPSIHLTGEQTIHGGGGQEVQDFNITVPSTGILVADVITKVPNQAAARLTLLGQDCTGQDCTGQDCAGTPEQSDFITVEQSLSHQMIAFRSPGTWSIRVASADSETPLGAYEIRLSFVAARVAEEDIDLGNTKDASPLRAHQIEFSIETPDPRSEQAAVDPDPDAPVVWSETGVKVLSLVTFYSTPVGRSEQAAIDPDPDTPFTFELAADEKLAQVVLYPGGIALRDGSDREASSRLGNGASTPLLRRLAALLWPPSRR